MDVRPDFAARVEDSCRTIPQEPIALLLKMLLPKDRTPTTKPAAYASRAPEPPVRFDAYGRVMPTGSVKPRRRMAASHPVDRVRVARQSTYRILQPMAHRNHRSGTWRYAMVRAVMASQSTTEAFEYLKREFPEHAGKGIDFKWNVAQGYITFDMAGDGLDFDDDY